MAYILHWNTCNFTLIYRIMNKVDAWYRALKTFYRLALQPSNLYQFKLEPSKLSILCDIK